jgi:Fe-S-cluster containining protein
MKAPFERTVCDCALCSGCCKQQPGFLIPSDVEAIAKFMDLPVEEFARTYLRKSPGALVGDRSTGQTWRIGTIVSAPDPTGRCVFLDSHDRCLIHPVAPFGCSMYDSHMDPFTANARTVWSLRLVASDADYQRLRETLPDAASYRPFDRR